MQKSLSPDDANTIDVSALDCAALDCAAFVVTQALMRQIEVVDEEVA